MNHYKLAKGGVSKTTSSRLLYYGRVCAWYQVPGKTKQSLRIIRRRQWLAKKCWCQFIENASFQASSINLALTWFLLFVRTWYQVPGTGTQKTTGSSSTAVVPVGLVFKHFLRLAISNSSRYLVVGIYLVLQ